MACLVIYQENDNSASTSNRPATACSKSTDAAPYSYVGAGHVKIVVALFCNQGGDHAVRYSVSIVEYGRRLLLVH
jgi:hypothetical protein